MLEQILAKRLAARQDMERRIVSKIIDVVLDNDYTISIDSGDDIAICQSSDKEDILAAMFSTDEDKILLYKDGKSKGYIWLIYGNSGWDVIHDYSSSLEVMLNPVHDLVDSVFINAD